MENSLNKEALLEQLKSNECIKIYKDRNINAVLLFGSFAEGNFYDDSDIDIGILRSESFDTMDLIDIEDEIGKIFNREIDVVDLSSDDIDIRFKVTVYDTGILIYNDENNLYEKDYNRTDRIYKNNETFRFFRERDVLDE